MVNLSKSRFLAGLQCHKRFWFEDHPQSAAPDPPDPLSVYLQEQGRDVGRLARALLSPGSGDRGGSASSRPWPCARPAPRWTRGRSVLFEAAAQGGGAFARADLLLRQGPAGPWDLLEVKASGHKWRLPTWPTARRISCGTWRSSATPLPAAGFAMGRSRLALVNKDYVRQGAPGSPGPSSNRWT